VHEAKTFPDVSHFIDDTLKTHLSEDEVRLITFPIIYSSLADVQFHMPSKHAQPMVSFLVLLEAKELYIKFVSYIADSSELNVGKISLGGRLEIFDVEEHSSYPGIKY
jgi:hypothetical protein